MKKEIIGITGLVTLLLLVVLVLGETENEGITIGTDDCDESGFGTVDTTSVVADLSQLQWGAGFRFQNVDIPQGSTINSAVLKLQMADYDCALGGCNNDIYGVDADDTSTWGAGYKPSSQAKTTATLAWDETTTGTWTARSHDVQAIVQEIVNRGGWSSGNSMSFLVDVDIYGRRKNLDITTMENTGINANPPYLTIDYTPPSAGTNMKVNIGDIFKDVDEIKINIGDVWKTATEVKINIGDTWKVVYE